MKTTKIISSIIATLVISAYIGFSFGAMWLIGFVAFSFLLLQGLSFSKKSAATYALACGTLTSSFTADCNTKPTAGLEVDVYFINRDDIDLTASTVSGRTISDIVLDANTYAYKFSGLKTSNNSSIVMNPGKYSNNWIHGFTGVIFDNTAATKEDIVETLAASNLVAIVRNKWKGTNSNMEFEVLGWAVGLEMSAAEKKSDDADTQNSWKITLASPKDQFEDNAGYIFHDTDQSTTYAKLQSITFGS